jgi:glycosyltransferase involved in cell wall biosynthesis
MPRVSILMPVRDRVRFVEAAVRSVLTQSFADLELLVMDDGSSDGSADLADRLAAGDPRLRVLRRTMRGVAPSLAELYELASGEMVGVVDSDDLLVKSAIEKCVRVLDADPAVGVVYTQHVMIDEHDRSMGIGYRSTIPFDKHRLLVEFMTLAFRLVRKDVYRASGGIDPMLPAAPDYDLCLKLSEVTTFRRIDESLYLYRVHPDMLSKSRRAEQLLASRVAVERAIVRRGLDATYRLDVDAAGQFRLVPR